MSKELSREIEKCSQDSHRIASLDCLRGLAAIGVVFCHLLPEIEIEKYRAGFWVGAYGVELFFMISGFVILQSLHRNRPLSFCRSRFLRLFPTFWFCVFLTTAILAILAPTTSPSIAKLLANLTMVPKQFAGIDGYIDGSYWTLEYELYFYVFAGLVFYLFGRNALCISLLGLVLINIAITSLGVIDLLEHMPKPAGSAIMRLYGFFFIEYAHLFLIGILCSVRQHYSKTVVAGACIVCLFAGMLNNRHSEVSANANAVALLVSFMVFWYSSTKDPLFLKNRRNLLWLGGISYPLYLVHQSIGLTLCDSLSLTGLLSVAWVLLVIGLMILLAAFVANVVEPPLQKFVKGMFPSGSREVQSH